MSDLTVVPLRDLCGYRSGDKGDNANIGIFARRPEYVTILDAEVTEEAVAKYFAHRINGPVTRWRLPGIGGEERVGARPEHHRGATGFGSRGGRGGEERGDGEEHGEALPPDPTDPAGRERPEDRPDHLGAASLAEVRHAQEGAHGAKRRAGEAPLTDVRGGG